MDMVERMRGRMIVEQTPKDESGSDDGFFTIEGVPAMVVAEAGAGVNAESVMVAINELVKAGDLVAVRTSGAIHYMGPEQAEEIVKKGEGIYTK